MGQENTPPQRSRSRLKGTMEERIAQTAIEVSYAVMRAEGYSEHLVNQMYLLFGADSGAGLTAWRLNSATAADQVTLVAAGTPPISEEQTLRARDFAGTHPGVVAMFRAGTTDAIRVSDHTNLPRFWTTEAYWCMHGHSDGRYAAAALLLNTSEVQIFVGVQRHSRDFGDADLAALAALQRPIAAAISFRAALDDTVGLFQNGGTVPPEQLGPVAPLTPTLHAASRLCGEIFADPA